MKNPFPNSNSVLNVKKEDLSFEVYWPSSQVIVREKNSKPIPGVIDTARNIPSSWS
jgi:hypothetical protein